MAASDGHWPLSRRVVTSVLEIQTAAAGPSGAVSVPTGVIILAIFPAPFNESRALGRVEVMGAGEAAPDMTGQIAAIGWFPHSWDGAASREARKTPQPMQKIAGPMISAPVA
jgi:hypothetical protein